MPNDTFMCHSQRGAEIVLFLWLQVFHRSICFAGHVPVGEYSLNKPIVSPSHTSYGQAAALFQVKFAISFSSILQTQERLQCHELVKEGLHIFM